jgi:hypothetical protein
MQMSTTKNSKPILVTGSHRSGSTWTGRIISTAPHVGYIHEPFNIGINTGVNTKPMGYWFRYISAENQDDYYPALNRVVQYEYPFGRNILRAGTFKNAARIVRTQGLSLLHKVNNDRPLIKDPIAIFSAEWLHATFDMNVLVLIRHPAAFCSSLKIKNWKFSFNNLLKQPLLMDKYLYPFEEAINDYAENDRNIIEQATLLWNCIHHVISIYQEKYPAWLFMRHEDLSTDPVNQFLLIFKTFDLEFNAKVKNRIHETSGAHNPVEQQQENPFKRDSKENISNWKKRLTREEISLIRKRTAGIADLFYTEDEW